MHKTTIARAAAALGVATALALAAPLAASAHVRVSPGTATAGSYATLTFKVPNESATAGTVKLEVDFPTDTPFSSVSYQPIGGWSTQVVTETLPKPVKTATATITEAVTKVIWTADAGVQIGQSQFQQFTVSAGPVPSTGSVELPARQTYSDGTVVNWNEKTPASGVEPEHPAPTLYVNDAPPAADAGAGSTSGASASVTATAGPAAGSGTAGSATTSSGTAGSAGDGVAIGIGIAGLLLGAIALVVSVFSLNRRRPMPGTPAAGAVASATAATPTTAEGK